MDSPLSHLRKAQASMYAELANAAEEVLLGEEAFTSGDKNVPVNDVVEAMDNLLNALDASVKLAHNSSSPQYAIRDLASETAIDRNRAVRHLAKLGRLYPPRSV